jgi:hypothetical protein
MLIVLLIFGLSLLPALVSVAITLRTQNRLSADFSRAMEAASQRGIRALLRRDRDLNYVEGIGYLVGDFTCQMNARSPHLRCAMNPCGPCQGCAFYEEVAMEEPRHRVPKTVDACPLPPMPQSCPWPRVPVYASV